MGCCQSARPQTLEEGYEVGQQLGRGHFATVYAGTRKADGLPVAVKVITRELFEAAEVDMLRAVGSHPAIIELYDVFKAPSAVQLVLELVTGGELFEHLVNHGPYSEADTAKHMRRLLAALKFLHGKNIVHCDLKPENILLTDSTSSAECKLSSPPPSPRLLPHGQLADFGLARALHTDEKVVTACGTWAYCAPEVLARTGFDTQADMWSMGVIIYVLLSGYHPFDPDCNRTTKQMKRAIKEGAWDFSGEAWADVSDAAKDLIRQLLTPDPARRLTADAALKHPWLRGAALRKQLSVSIADDLQSYRVRMRRKLKGSMLATLAIASMQTLSVKKLPQAPPAAGAGAAAPPAAASESGDQAGSGTPSPRRAEDDEPADGAAGVVPFAEPVVNAEARRAAEALLMSGRGREAVQRKRRESIPDRDLEEAEAEAQRRARAQELESIADAVSRSRVSPPAQPGTRA